MAIDLTGIPLDGRTYIWASPPMRIGAHEWRVCVVEDFSLYTMKTERMTACEWRRATTGAWTDGWSHARTWPSYDMNDGAYSGLPRTLTKLWNMHKDHIRALLEGRAPEAPKQATLFAEAV